MAAESYWFKINPEKYLSIAGRIPDGVQRAEFVMLCMHCLATQGPLPDDDEEIAFITTLPVEHIKALRPYLNRLCRIEDGQIIPTLAEETIAERREFSERQAANGRSGGKKTQGSLSEPRTPLSTAQAPLSEPQAPSSGAQAIQTNKQTNKQNKHTAAAGEIGEFFDESSDDNAAAAAVSVEIKQLADQLANLYGLKDSGGWKLRGQFESCAIQLHGVEATTAELQAFWAYRRKKPGIQHVVTDFLDWRVNQTPATTGNVVNISNKVEADLKRRENNREKYGFRRV